MSSHIEEIPIERMHDAAKRVPIDTDNYSLEQELADWKQLALDQGKDANRYVRTIVQLRDQLKQRKEAEARPRRRLRRNPKGEVPRARQMINVSCGHTAGKTAAMMRQLVRELHGGDSVKLTNSGDSRAHLVTVVEIPAKRPYREPGTTRPYQSALGAVPVEERQMQMLREEVISANHDVYVERFGVNFLPAPGQESLEAPLMRADLAEIRANSYGQLRCLASDRVVAEDPLTTFGGSIEYVFPRCSYIQFRLDFEQWARPLHYRWWAQPWMRGRRVYHHDDLTRR
jgi:hypothetical protein